MRGGVSGGVIFFPFRFEDLSESDLWIRFPRFRMDPPDPIDGDLPSGESIRGSEADLSRSGGAAKKTVDSQS